MAKEKNKPVPVRFDLKLLEVLKEEEKIETPQQALNFLSQFWENNRPAKEGFEQGLTNTEAKEPVGTGGKGKDAKVKATKAAPAATPAVATASETKKKAGEPGAHPSGLSGIDLSIWKAEQKEKERNNNAG